MANYTISTTLNNDDAYAVDMDATCIGADYDTAYPQYQVEQTDDDCDIEFE